MECLGPRPHHGCRTKSDAGVAPPGPHARNHLHSEIEAVDPAHVSACVIAIKPQILKMEAPRLRRFAQAGALVLSIAAGTSVASLAKACGRRARIVRAMPNLPGAIGHGMTVLYAPRAVSKADRRTAQRLMQALGATAWVPKETMIDTVTAVSGSGPAYVFFCWWKRWRRRRGRRACRWGSRNISPVQRSQAPARCSTRRAAAQPICAGMSARFRRHDRSGAADPHGRRCVCAPARTGRGGRARSVPWR